MGQKKKRMLSGSSCDEDLVLECALLHTAAARPGVSTIKLGDHSASATNVSDWGAQ
jgi:hypothetical protein